MRFINVYDEILRLSAKEEYSTSLSLVDILFAYCYDFRTTDWEHSVESGGFKWVLLLFVKYNLGWNISHLAPSLSWLVRWKSVREAVIGCFSRALTKPLYRYLGARRRLEVIFGNF